MHEDFAEICAASIDRLTALLSDAEAIDTATAELTLKLAELVPEKPKRRSNGNAVAMRLYESLKYLPVGAADTPAFVPQLQRAIAKLEDELEQAVEEAEADDREELTRLEQAARELRLKLGLPSRDEASVEDGPIKEATQHKEHSA